MPIYLWSQLPGSNASGDGTINWAEGQAPSTVNDSARAMMAATAKYRDDIAGAIVTGGTSTAYTVSTFSSFDTLAHLNGQVIGFTPHTTNGATVTLNVDSLGAKPLRPAPSVELQSGVLIQGTPYVAVYNNSDGVFYLRGVGAAPGIPLGSGMDYWGATAPTTAFALAQGQAISRTTYATLFALFGTTYGSGDGSTTFNIPDKVGRVSAMVDGGSARLSSTYFGANPANRGAVGGGEGALLAANQIPAGVPSSGSIAGTAASGSGSIPSMNNTIIDFAGNLAGGGTDHVPAFVGAGGSWSGNASLTVAGTASVSSTNASQAGVRTVQPTIICNYIIRVI